MKFHRGHESLDKLTSKVQLIHQLANQPSFILLISFLSSAPASNQKQKNKKIISFTLVLSGKRFFLSLKVFMNFI